MTSQPDPATPSSASAAPDAPPAAATVPAAAITSPPGYGRWMLMGAAFLLVAALAFAFSRNARPLSADAGPAASSAAASGPTTAALEARVAANPNDAAAWAELGQARYDQSDYPGAVAAYTRATTIAPNAGGNWSALGDALVMTAPQNGPPIPPNAIAAFNRALAINAKDPRARYFLATKKDVDGDHQGAIRDWLALLADTPRGAPWEQDLRRTIQQVGARNGIPVQARMDAVRQREMAPSELPVAAQAIPGPTREQMQSAAALPKGQQDMMVDQMVEGLQARLDADPRQPDRWIMLMRSRMTLGQTDRASAALRAAMAANPDQAERIRAQARLLGVPGA